ncbi:MAG TPA: subclass B3 metallo-beta-lactamase [Candidatus Koribacter sp.]|jgi:metallo-beta-lactamase class B
MLRFLAAFLLATTSLFAEVPADWTTPIEPFKIAGNLYYVGSRDLAAYLIVTPAGNILVNANLESSPPLIRHSIEQLGFQWKDTKFLLSSQAHSDHVGGAAAILRETGAQFDVMDGDVDVVESGGRTSFDLPDSRFPAAHVSRALHDRDTISLGGTTVTALRTAGHTRGCTTFTMHVKENGRDLLVVIVGGISSNPGVRYVAMNGKPPSYLGIEPDFERTFATYESLPADIFLGAHGGYFDMLEKLDKGARTNPALWIDQQGYKSAITKAKDKFEDQLAKQKAEAK